MATVSVKSRKLVKKRPPEKDKVKVRVSEQATYDDKLTCQICYNPYYRRNAENVIEMPHKTSCGHQFGDNCWKEHVQIAIEGVENYWSPVRVVCPMCRTQQSIGRLGAKGYLWKYRLRRGVRIVAERVKQGILFKKPTRIVTLPVEYLCSQAAPTKGEKVKDSKAALDIEREKPEPKLSLAAKAVMQTQAKTPEWYRPISQTSVRSRRSEKSFGSRARSKEEMDETRRSLERLADLAYMENIGEDFIAQGKDFRRERDLTRLSANSFMLPTSTGSEIAECGRGEGGQIQDRDESEETCQENPFLCSASSVSSLYPATSDVRLGTENAETDLSKRKTDLSVGEHYKGDLEGIKN